MRVQATMLAVCLALVYGLNVTTPGLLDRAGQVKGTDFSNFYVLGTIARRGPEGALYDRTALAAVAHEILPESRGVYYLPIYGPQVSLLFAPFSLLPYGWALALWIAISSGVYAACCLAFWRICPHLRGDGALVAIVAAASPAFFNLVAHGQNSAVALACFTGAFFAIRNGRPFVAGLAIGSLVFKPQLGIAAACVFVICREWRVVAGAVAGAAVQIGATWLYYGSDVLGAYGRWLLGIGEINALLAIKPFQMHSLMAFWNLLIPWPWLSSSLYAATALAVAGIAIRVWRSRTPLELRFATLLLCTVLVSPHLYVYDLLILAPALLLIADWALGHPQERIAQPVQLALYFVYVLPLAGAAAQFTRVQLSVVAMAALTVTIAGIALRAPDPFASHGPVGEARV